MDIQNQHAGVEHFSAYCDQQNAATALAGLLAKLISEDVQSLIDSGRLGELLRLNQRLVNGSEKAASRLLANQIQSVNDEDSPVDYAHLFACLESDDREVVNALIDRLVQ